MTKAKLHEQIDAMTEEEAAEVRLVYAPDWSDKVTLIEDDPEVLSAVEAGIVELEHGDTVTLAELRNELAERATNQHLTEDREERLNARLRREGLGLLARSLLRR
jgi:hypothetical protein